VIAAARCSARRLGRALDALRAFTRERFPLYASAPIAALLYAAPASLRNPSRIEAVEGALATFLGLLCLRIADDLSDLERDRALHPRRGLPSGRIAPASLLEANLALWAALAAIESRSAWRFAFFVGACGFYAVWFSGFRARVHAVARPFFSNLVFPCAVFHGAGPGAWWPAALLALYAWLAAVAHELGHNARTPESDGPHGPGYARALGARGTAMLSVVLFAGAWAAAALLWLQMGRPGAFGGALLGAAAGLGLFLARLLRDQKPRHARALYRAGILFALAPALGLLLRS
jgi:4-hydroxybenzoate polyprenyltransferase